MLLLVSNTSTAWSGRDSAESNSSCCGTPLSRSSKSEARRPGKGLSLLVTNASTDPNRTLVDRVLVTAGQRPAARKSSCNSDRSPREKGERRRSATSEPTERTTASMNGR